MTNDVSDRKRRPPRKGFIRSGGLNRLVPGGYRPTMVRKKSGFKVKDQTTGGPSGQGVADDMGG
jgi:hypothetical protein